MLTTVVGSWPPAEEYQPYLDMYFKGELPEERVEPILTAAAQTAVEDQRRCGLDEWTGGETSADSFVLHFPRRFANLQLVSRAAWGERGEWSLMGPLLAPDGLGLAEAFKRERVIDPHLAKVTVPGPSEVTMMIRRSGPRASLWADATELLREEIRQLVGLGATEVQLDLPHVAMGLADGGWETHQALALVKALFDGIKVGRRSVHLCYGDFQARSWAKNQSLEPLIPFLKGLAGKADRVLLELSLPAQWAQIELLKELPVAVELAAGVLDVKSEEPADVAELAARLAELRRVLPQHTLLACPSCGLGRRTRAAAWQKASALVEAARKV